jgi:hypothetical protein
MRGCAHPWEKGAGGFVKSGPGVGPGAAAADAYRQLRHVQHWARLNEDSTQLEMASMGGLADQRAAVLRLWMGVLGV